MSFIVSKFNDIEYSDIIIKVENKEIYVAHILVDGHSDYIRNIKKCDTVLKEINIDGCTVRKIFTIVELPQEITYESAYEYFNYIYTNDLLIYYSFKKWSSVYVLADFLNDKITKEYLIRKYPSTVNFKLILNFYRKYEPVRSVIEEQIHRFDNIPITERMNYIDVFEKFSDCYFNDIANLHSKNALYWNLCYAYYNTEYEFNLLEFINADVELFEDILCTFNITKIKWIEEIMFKIAVLGTCYEVEFINYALPHGKIDHESLDEVEDSLLDNIDIDNIHINENIYEIYKKYWNRRMEEYTDDFIQ